MSSEALSIRSSTEAGVRVPVATDAKVAGVGGARAGAGAGVGTGAGVGAGAGAGAEDIPLGAPSPLGNGEVERGVPIDPLDGVGRVFLVFLV